MAKRHRNDGLRKRCGCPRKQWPKCPHAWHLNFQWDGRHYRVSLGRHARAAPHSKTDARKEADRVRSAIRDGTYRPRRRADRSTCRGRTHIRGLRGPVR